MPIFKLSDGTLLELTLSSINFDTGDTLIKVSTHKTLLSQFKHLAYFPDVRLGEQTRDGEAEDGDEAERETVKTRGRGSHLSGD